MKKCLLLLLIAQAFTPNAFAEKQEQNSSDYNLSEVEDLAPAQSTVSSYLWTKEAQGSRKALTKTATTVSPLMTAHTNPIKVMSTVVTTPIFWGSSWSGSQANPIFISDKIVGLTLWYNNLQSSPYTSTVSEYTTLNHSLIAPLYVTSATSVSSSNPANVLAQVCTTVGTANLKTNGFYPVYTDLPRGTANYCAYHSAGICAGTPVQFAFFFNIDNDPGCDPASPYAPKVGTTNAQAPGSILTGGSGLPQQSQGLAALANITAHELMETVTDPAYFTITGGITSGYWGGWYDSTGAENGDKCAWTFGPSNNTGLSAGTVLIGGYDWKLQGEWSNKAQNAKTGYPTQSGLLKGCVTGS